MESFWTKAYWWHQKKLSKKKNYLVEFVSANPTGPLHVGHCRGAILGDVISNVLIFNKHKVTKEYYVNDYGGQVKIFVISVYYRILEIIENKPFPHNKDLYPGDYIIDIAKRIIKNKSIKKIHLKKKNDFFDHHYQKYCSLFLITRSKKKQKLHKG